MSCPTKEVLIFDDDTSGEFLHIKLHLQVTAVYALSVGQTLFMPIASVFGSKFSPHTWEVFTQSRCKKTEYLQSSPDLPTIVQKHSAIIDINKIPKDTDKCPHSLAQDAAYSSNKDVLVNGKRGPT